MSGGKDSAVLLSVLLPASKAADVGVEIVPILVDMDDGPYWDESRQAARQLTCDLGLELLIVSLKDRCGATLGEIVSRHPRPSRTWAACDVCTKLRTRVLRSVLSELGIETLATGINLDDRAANFLFYSTTPQGPEVFRRSTKAIFDDNGITHLQCLVTVLDSEAEAYANLRGLPVVDRECPYADENVIKVCKNGLLGIEQQIPGFRYALVQALGSLDGSLKVKPQYHRCPVCGMTLSRSPAEPCHGCSLIAELLLEASSRAAEGASPHE